MNKEDLIAFIAANRVKENKPDGYMIFQNEYEFADYIFFLREQLTGPINYLEIGVACGGSARIVCDYLHIDTLTLVDFNLFGKRPPLKRKSVYYPKNRSFFRYKQLRELNADSTEPETYQKLKEAGVQYDVIFIDGSHSFASAKSDYEMALKLRKPNGFIAFHDAISNIYSGVPTFLEQYLGDDVKLVQDCSVPDGNMGIKVYQ